MTWLYLLIALQFADVATTLYFLKHTDLQEGNPVLRKLFGKFGPTATMLVWKSAAIAALLYYQDVLPIELIVGLCVFYIAVVANNVRLIIK